MKRILSVFVLSVMISGFMACTNSKSSSCEQANDTTLVVTRGGSERGGFGRCSENGCHCKEFKGRGQTCGNCGHAYKKHY